MSATKITIITEEGRLVGTHIAPPGRPDGEGPSARVVAGPGQMLREIEVDFPVPSSISNLEAVKEFHEKIRKTTSFK